MSALQVRGRETKLQAQARGAEGGMQPDLSRCRLAHPEGEGRSETSTLWKLGVWNGLKGGHGRTKGILREVVKQPRATIKAEQPPYSVSQSVN